MEVVDTLAAFSASLEGARALGRTVGLVPTMGALHAGHVSLIERAAAECDHVAVTIFVNPLQFGDPDDIARYPRPLDDDLGAAAAAGADLVFAPAVTEMYPDWPAAPATTVSVATVGAGFEGRSRPGHFDGVATVVTKLLAAAGSCRAYFGEKDFEQLAVVRRLVADLSLPVEIVGCPIVREADGLALSSRNVRLSGPERRAATVLSRALLAGRSSLANGERSPAAVVKTMASVVDGEPLVSLDYAGVVDDATLVEPVVLDDPTRLRLVIAGRVGPVRLIDNCAAVPGRQPLLAVAGRLGGSRFGDGHTKDGV